MAMRFESPREKELPEEPGELRTLFSALN